MTTSPAPSPLLVTLSVDDLRGLIAEALAGHTEQVMTSEECAALLKTSESTVLRHTRAGTLPARKLGGEYRYLRSEVLAALPGVTPAPAKAERKAS